MKETFSKMVLFVYMFPQILIIIPIYLMMSKMGLINTYKGLILCYIAFELPICIWTMQSYFETIPSDLIEAAEIDGLAKIQTLWHIFLPVALPGLADFSSRDSMLQGDVLAASMIVCIPSFLFALFAQKYLVGGLTSGSVKG